MQRQVLAVSAIITREEDARVYLGRRCASKTMWPLLWETIGGGLEGAETPEECIRREIREELSAEIRSITVLGDYPLGTGVVRVYMVTLMEEANPTLDDFKECAWVSEEEAQLLDFASNCKERVLHYFDHARRPGS